MLSGMLDRGRRLEKIWPLKNTSFQEIRQNLNLTADDTETLRTLYHR